MESGYLNNKFKQLIIRQASALIKHLYCIKNKRMAAREDFDRFLDKLNFQSFLVIIVPMKMLITQRKILFERLSR